MPLNRIVARFQDGNTIKGRTRDFYPSRAQFHLTTDDGRIQRIDARDLKAIFFVRDLTGDRGRKDCYEEIVQGVGRKMRITFEDGEVIVGYTPGYSRDRQGFFFVPANTECNNERMFILNGFCKEARFI